MGIYRPGPPRFTKLTKEHINSRLEERGFELIGEYTKSSIKTLFRCPVGHEWEAIPNNILRGGGCLVCVGRVPLTKEVVNQRLEDRKIVMLGDCRGGHTKTLFTHLVCGHEWETTPSGVMTGDGCPECAMSRRKNNQPHQLTKEIVNARLAERGIELIGEYVNNETKSLMRCNKGHEWMAIPLSTGCFECMKKPIEEVHAGIRERGYEMIGEYLDMKKKVLMRCGEGHEWMVSPQAVNAGSSCPFCSKTGYKPDKPGWFYILNFGGRFIKYGITNTLSNRMNDHTRNNGEYEIAFTRLFAVGDDAKSLESMVKQTFGGRYVERSVCPDGWTETLAFDKLELLLEAVR